MVVVAPRREAGPRGVVGLAVPHGETSDAHEADERTDGDPRERERAVVRLRRRRSGAPLRADRSGRARGEERARLVRGAQVHASSSGLRVHGPPWSPAAATKADFVSLAARAGQQNGEGFRAARAAPRARGARERALRSPFRASGSRVRRRHRGRRDFRAGRKTWRGPAAGGARSVQWKKHADAWRHPRCGRNFAAEMPNDFPQESPGAR